MIKLKTIQFCFIVLLTLIALQNANSQNYYFKEYQPFDKSIPSPEEFLGYPIGDFHTRHDLVVAYLEKLAELSDKANLMIYGKTNENRKLTILTITSPKNLQNIEAIKKKHLQVVDHNTNITDFSGRYSLQITFSGQSFTVQVLLTQQDVQPLVYIVAMTVLFTGGNVLTK